MDEMLRGIQEALETNQYKAFLTATDKSNFRYDIYPEYKATRKAEKPTHYHRLRDYLLETHGAELVLDQEADDALGIEQTYQMNEYNGQPDCETGYAGYPCIVTIDKDLDQIPGWHYNFVKKDKYWVKPEEGLRYFYEQILQGDRIDNVPGIHGIGPVTARRLLSNCKTEKEMYEVVLRKYEGRAEEVLRNGRLLKIRTTEGEIWQPPQ